MLWTALGGTPHGHDGGEDRSCCAPEPWTVLHQIERESALVAAGENPAATVRINDPRTAAPLPVPDMPPLLPSPARDPLLQSGTSTKGAEAHTYLLRPLRDDDTRFAIRGSRLDVTRLWV